MKTGDIVTTALQAQPLRLGKALPPGGQGSVFLVEGEPLVVKLYHPSVVAGAKREAQRHHLVSMIDEGPPSPAFVWPLDLIDQPSLGYVMAKVSRRFVPLQTLNWSAEPLGWPMRLRICFHMVQALARLHLRRGSAYCDLAPANVLCDPQTSKVRIIDTDNISADGQQNPLEVLGTRRYMAPELHSGAVRTPSIETDLHAIAVVLFETLLLHNPFLGDRVIEGAPEEEETALGERPVYIYHPNDASNRYAKYQDHGGVSPRLMPRRLMELFNETFVSGVASPRLRVRETRWLRALTDCLDLFVRCGTAGCFTRGAFLLEGRRLGNCPGCGSPLPQSSMLDFFDARGHYLRTKVIRGGEWLAAHHCKAGQLFNFDRGNACGFVESDPKHGLTIRNVSSETFMYRRADADAWSRFPPGERLALRAGTSMAFGASGTEAVVR